MQIERVAINYLFVPNMSEITELIAIPLLYILFSLFLFHFFWILTPILTTTKKK